jgi:hypothetical protein
MQIMYYIGLDKKTISYCVKDGGGGIHAVGKIPAKRLELHGETAILTPPGNGAISHTGT